MPNKRNWLRIQNDQYPDGEIAAWWEIHKNDPAPRCSVSVGKGLNIYVPYGKFNIERKSKSHQSGGRV